MLLQVTDLRVEFPLREGRIYAVKGITYALRARETLATIGESGSGKSVHVLAMLGMLRGQADVTGSVLFEGTELLTMPERELSTLRGSQIAYIPQDPMSALNPVLRIRRQMDDGLKRHTSLTSAQRKTRCEELLELVGIPDPQRVLDRYPHELSGGMRQRVLIAIAVSCSPKLIIADEPTTALDVTVQARIIDLVLSLKEQLGLAVIWITHDLSVTAALAETVQVMYAGKLLERGPVRSIFKDPRNAYTYGLLQSTPSANPDTKRLPQIQGQLPPATQLFTGDPFAPRNPFATKRCFVEMPPMLPVPNGAPGHETAAWYDLAKLRREGRVWQ